MADSICLIIPHQPYTPNTIILPYGVLTKIYEHTSPHIGLGDKNSALNGWTKQHDSKHIKTDEKPRCAQWQLLNLDLHGKCDSPGWTTTKVYVQHYRSKRLRSCARTWLRRDCPAFAEISSKYSHALQNSQSCTFLKWHSMLHPKVAFEAPWACTHCSMKSIPNSILHRSSNQIETR